MHYLRGIVDWITALESGEPFRKWVSILVKILGVCALIGAVVWGITLCIGSIVASEYMGTSSRTFVIIGTILSLCINIIVGLILVMLFWNRSNKINALRDETHFTWLPITVILIRLFGEFSFLSLVGTGIQAVLASIFGFTSLNLMDFLLSDLARNISFIFGVISFVSSVLVGAVILIFTYFIAELISIFTDAVTNLKKIETALANKETSEDTSSDS